MLAIVWVPARNLISELLEECSGWMINILKVGGFPIYELGKSTDMNEQEFLNYENEKRIKIP